MTKAANKKTSPVRGGSLLAALPGFEPRLTESESAVLPLDDKAIISCRRVFTLFYFISQTFFNISVLFYVNQPILKVNNMIFMKTNEKILQLFKSWWWKNPQKNQDITPAQAKQIQKQANLNINPDLEKGYTKTYLVIAAHLGAEKQQIFEAAVYYLCTIAVNKPQYQQPIIEILGTYMNEHKNQPERLAFIENMLIQSKWNV